MKKFNLIQDFLITIVLVYVFNTKNNIILKTKLKDGKFEIRPLKQIEE